MTEADILTMTKEEVLLVLRAELNAVFKHHSYGLQSLYKWLAKDVDKYQQLGIKPNTRQTMFLSDLRGLLGKYQLGDW